jgi:hypothetical protein
MKKQNMSVFALLLACLVVALLLRPLFLYFDVAWTWFSAITPVVMWWFSGALGLIVILIVFPYSAFQKTTLAIKSRPFNPIDHLEQQLVEGKYQDSIKRLLSMYLWQEAHVDRCNESLALAKLAKKFDPSLYQKIIKIFQKDANVDINKEEFDEFLFVLRLEGES